MEGGGLPLHLANTGFGQNAATTMNDSKSLSAAFGCRACSPASLTVGNVACMSEGGRFRNCDPKLEVGMVALAAPQAVAAALKHVLLGEEI